jgi:hypothetical protein
MATQNLEQRVEILESQLGKLLGDVRASKPAWSKDWRRTIGAFTDDEGMQQILRDAMRLREADRKKFRATRTSKRKSRR